MRAHVCHVVTHECKMSLIELAGLEVKHFNNKKKVKEKKWERKKENFT